MAQLTVINGFIMIYNLIVIGVINPCITNCSGPKL